MLPPAPIIGGYFIVARQLLESSMMDAPPLHWKLWIWMLGKANWKDRGKLKRGQFVCSINEMRDAMSHRVGYRVVRPTKDQIRSAYEALTKATMITTAKTTRGMVVTIINFNKYQTPENYEAHNEAHNETRTNPEATPQDTEEFEERSIKKTTPPPTCKPQSVGPDGCPSGEGGFSSGPGFEDRPKPPPGPVDVAYSREFWEFCELIGEDPYDALWSVWGSVCRRRNFSAQWRDNIPLWLDSEQWTKEGGRYKPSAENILRKGYWQRKPPKQASDDPYAYLLEEDD